MKIHLFRILFAIIYSIIAFYSFGNIIDGTPFHVSDVIIMLFVAIGVVMASKYSGDYIHDLFLFKRKDENNIKR
jgi:hypothetical protein